MKKRRKKQDDKRTAIGTRNKRTKNQADKRTNVLEINAKSSLIKDQTY